MIKEILYVGNSTEGLYHLLLGFKREITLVFIRKESMILEIVENNIIDFFDLDSFIFRNNLNVNVIDVLKIKQTLRKNNV